MVEKWSLLAWGLAEVGLGASLRWERYGKSLDQFRRWLARLWKRLEQSRKQRLEPLFLRRCGDVWIESIAGHPAIHNLPFGRSVLFRCLAFKAILPVLSMRCGEWQSSWTGENCRVRWPWLDRWVASRHMEWWLFKVVWAFSTGVFGLLAAVLFSECLWLILGSAMPPRWCFATQSELLCLATQYF